jgi:hypothetical protein
MTTAAAQCRIQPLKVDNCAKKHAQHASATDLDLELDLGGAS